MAKTNAWDDYGRDNPFNKSKVVKSNTTQIDDQRHQVGEV
jgi:hypothetical protein